VFKSLDANGDGIISPQDMRNGLRRISPTMSDENIEAIIAAADSNGDGHLNYREFLNFIESDPNVDNRARDFFGTSPIPCNPSRSGSRQSNSVNGGMESSFGRMDGSRAQSREGVSSMGSRPNSVLSSSNNFVNLPPSSNTNYGEKKIGRFASTPEPYNTNRVISQAESSSGFVSEAERFVRRNSTPVGGSSSEFSTKGKEQQRMEAKRALRAKNDAEIAERSRRNDEARDKLENARAERKASARRRYIERCLLYDELQKPPTKKDDGHMKQITQSEFGFVNLFWKSL
jgi:hypothetical protein